MKLKKLESITEIKKGDTIVISGDDLKSAARTVQMIVSVPGCTEVIIDKKLNKFFNFDMYLKGESWVKECCIIVD